MKTAKAPAAKKPSAKKPATKVETQNRLVPVVAANEDEVIQAAFDGTRRRPVVAIDAEGKLMVCCRRTAAKHGWVVEGTMFTRNRSKLSVNAQGKLAKKPAAKARSEKTVKELLK